ncbi:hypothetical protein EKO27_g10473, partial [Xylaria grammica]
MYGILRLAKTWSPQACKVPRLQSAPRDEQSSGMEVEEKADEPRSQSVPRDEQPLGIEAIEQADEPVASVKALSEFRFYPRLPAELKLEIWVEVFKHWSSGVHCFTLTIDPDDRTRLTIQPSGYREDDSSAWRERYALARIDKYSFDGLLRFERRATTLYHDTLHRHTVRVEENGLSAVVDGKTDLITFRYQYGATRASLSFLDFSAHWDIFENITRIGVDYHYYVYGPKKRCKQKPFAYVYRKSHNRKVLGSSRIVVECTAKFSQKTGVIYSDGIPGPHFNTWRVTTMEERLNSKSLFAQICEASLLAGMNGRYEGRDRGTRIGEFNRKPFLQAASDYTMSLQENSTLANDLLVAAQLVRYNPASLPSSLSFSHALFQVVRQSADQLLKAWLYAPIGIVAILATAFGVDKLLRLGAVSFPASVACLIVLFLALLLLEQIIGEHRTRRVVAVLEIPAGWALRWINVFFTPSFVLLPLSPPIGGIEVLKIIAVFVIGFVVMMALAAYMTRGLQLVLGSSKRAAAERAEELGNASDEIPMTVTTSRSADTPSTRTASEAPVASEVPEPLSSESRDTPPTQTPQGSCEASRDADPPRDLSAHTPPPSARATRWALVISSRLDTSIYALLFAFVGLPVYYAADYAMPLHLTFCVLAYATALSVPPAWRHYLHPVLVASLLTVLGVWVLGLVKGQTSLPHSTISAPAPPISPSGP